MILCTVAYIQSKLSIGVFNTKARQVQVMDLVDLELMNNARLKSRCKCNDYCDFIIPSNDNLKEPIIRSILSCPGAHSTATPASNSSTIFLNASSNFPWPSSSLVTPSLGFLASKHAKTASLYLSPM